MRARPSTPRPLVADVHLRGSLAALRALGRAGYRPVALGPSAAAAGLWSRHAAARAVAGTGSVTECAEAVARRHGPVVVYPGQESTIDALIASTSPDVRTPYASHAALDRLRDKRALAELASAVGLAAPDSLTEASAAELRGWEMPAPCVVKPVRPGGALATAVPVGSAADLDALLDTLPPDELLMVQERAMPPLTALVVVIGPGGQLLARFQQEARRTWPPDAGTSSVAVGVEPDDDLARRATELLGSVGFGGLTQMQFVRTARGRALIDINPRFYGSLPLALASGVNLPAAWHASVVGDPTPVPGPYRLGVTYRWLEGELLNAVRGGRPAADALKEAARVALRPPARPRTGSAWAGDDPLPGVMLGSGLLTAMAGRRLRRR